MKRSLTAVASGVALMAGALTAAPAAAEPSPCGRRTSPARPR